MKLPEKIHGKTPTEWSKEFEQRHEITEFKHNYTPPPMRWLVEGLFLHPGRLNGLLGMSNAGKSRFLRWIIAHLLAGKEPFGLRIESEIQRILWCGSEEHYDAFHAGIKRYGELIGADTSDWDKRLIHLSGAGMGLDVMENRIGFLCTIANHSPELVVLDSLRYFHSAEEKGSPGLTALINDLRRWTNQYRFSMFMNHHTGKMAYDAELDNIYNWVRGDSHLTAAMDTVTALRRFGAIDAKGGQEVNLYRFGRHGPAGGPWTLKDLGREDPNQPATTDLGWELVKKGGD